MWRKRLNEDLKEVYEQARLAKDARFDGRFFIGVRTTGIYCRPVCPVKPPRARNVVFFGTAAAAAEAGFRPCLRCRPESAPGTPAWAGTSTTVSRGLRLIAEGALDTGTVESLSDRLGVTPRHLSRLFMQHLGASPIAIAQTRRLQFAKRLLDETSLPMTEIALASGYGSVRRFNDHFRSVYGRAPSTIRSNRDTEAASGFSIRLPYRPPYNFRRTLAFLAVRATPGVELVEEGEYRRTIRIGDEIGSISVSDMPGNYLRCDVDLPSSRYLMEVINRVRRLFDLDADPMEIECHLGRDDILGAIVAENPGQRVVGSWDPFEVLIRAIVGQQVSVKGATTVMGKIVQMFGESSHDCLLFPLPESLSKVVPGSLPMPRSRSDTIRAAAAAVVSGEIDLAAEDVDVLRAQLVSIKGIGPWTAQYVSMRAVGDPDAMLSGDLVLRRVAEKVFGVDSEPALLDRAERWRPWRAYACMHLWGIAKEI